MPRKATPLTDSAIKVAKPKDSPYKLTDGQGLYLEVTPNGSKLWRLKYRFDGKEKRLRLKNNQRLSNVPTVSKVDRFRFRSPDSRPEQVRKTRRRNEPLEPERGALFVLGAFLGASTN
jgi:hypothetical protein